MRWIAYIVLCGCWTGAAPAPAPIGNTSSAPPVVERLPREDTQERARRLFESGEEHYNLGEFAEAVADFEAAYHAVPKYVMLYNIAQAYRQAGDRQHAIESYQRYLVEGGGKINQIVRDMVNDQIQKLSAP